MIKFGRVIGLFLIGWLFFPCFAQANSKTESAPIILQVKDREIVVNGKKSQVYTITQSNGIQGLFLKKGDLFNVILENHINQPTGVHWHGILLPNNQDGVPFVTQPPIPPGGKYAYQFPLIQSGTYWMHAHYGLEEQKLLTAPLILYDPSDHSQLQQVVMFLSDFTFRDPREIFNELRKNGAKNMPGMGKMAGMNQEAKSEEDLNDVKYDAYLTNWRTLSNPDVLQVDPEQAVRLRIIDGSSSANFFIDLGKLKGEAIAVDGSDIVPFSGSRFQIAVAQRVDILLKIPKGIGAYPIIAQGEGTNMQTGLLLATPGAEIPSLKEKGNSTMGALSYAQEFVLKAKAPFAKQRGGTQPCFEFGRQHGQVYLDN